MSRLPSDTLLPELPGRPGYEVTQESRFNDPDAKPFLGTVVDYVFENREVFRTKMDVFTGEHSPRATWILVASCATQGAALAAARLLNTNPKPVPPLLRLVKVGQP